MVEGNEAPARARFLPSGDEAGTAPGDRPFRPDVEGLRAVAVALVVLFHAGVPGVPGGYVGVDVFYVISGFVITGLLLRERAATGRTSVLSFYARRCRRILPAATLVLLATVGAAYLVLGVVSGVAVADDGRWTAVFLANFHFSSQGTNYFLAQRPPSPLQNFWSLAVEEQFYVVYPTLFALLARFKAPSSGPRRLASALLIAVAGSYCLSVLQTASNPTAAYFSPFTRAWELAVGALVAVGTTWLRRLPKRLGRTLSWVGLGSIVGAALGLNGHTAYPGSLAAIPVLGTALVIVGGTIVPRESAERVLSKPPLLWLGKRSYSLYLWHWPILAVAAEYYGKNTLSVLDNLALVAVAVALSAATFRWVENPIRHWRLGPMRSVAAGAAVIPATVLLSSLLISSSAAATTSPPVSRSVPGTAALLQQVAEARHITTVPPAVRQAQYGAAYPVVSDELGRQCWGATVCTFGDPRSSNLMVVYGDSHTLMWAPAFLAIARAEHWRVAFLMHLSCPATWVEVRVSGCTRRWHWYASNWINQHHPQLVVISQQDIYLVSAVQWKEGLTRLFASISVPHSHVVLLGTTPTLTQAAPVCLSAHPSNVQICSTSVGRAVPAFAAIDRKAARAAGVGYIDTVPWFCTQICTAVIGSYVVYDAPGFHISQPWALHLREVLWQSLSALRTPPRSIPARSGIGVG